MRRGVVLGVIVVGALLARRCAEDRAAAPPLRFATFNIEMFPKDQRQIDGAFDEIERLDASFIAVQEISEPAVFVGAARRRLGRAWEFVHVDTRPRDEATARHASHHIGVLFDGRVHRLRAVLVHDETRVGRQKPTLEVRLAPVHGDAPDVAVFVVHLKSGGAYADIRARQLAALGGVVRAARAARPGDRVVVLGDFNATGEDDRREIAAVAAAADLAWATEPLACSAFWDRDDGCPRSRLDHVLTWAPPTAVHAAGACATEGCDWQDSCPLYAEHVSDHCPVVVTITPG